MSLKDLEFSRKQLEIKLHKLQAQRQHFVSHAWGNLAKQTTKEIDEVKIQLESVDRRIENEFNFG